MNITPDDIHGLAAFFAGMLLGLSLAAPPGPIIAVMAHESVRGRIHASLAMAFGAISGDAVWLALAALGTITVLKNHPHIMGTLGLCGALLLLWMAWMTLKNARHGFYELKTPGTLKLGFITSVSSPYNFGWWLANGALLITSWGWPGISGMFLALIIYSIGISYAFRWLGTKVESVIAQVAWVSAVMLAGFGLYFGWGALRLLLN